MIHPLEMMPNRSAAGLVPTINLAGFDASLEFLTGSLENVRNIFLEEIDES